MASPMTPPFTAQAGPYAHPSPMAPHFMPHPNYFPVFFGHPGSMGVPPPPNVEQFIGMTQPPMWSPVPEGGIHPFTQVSFRDLEYG
jgi:hypothetical protein